MIQVDLITGFLGSGKTTFLLKYARFLMRQGLRIGILEYDYGAVNVDMVLIGKLRGPQCEIEMVAAACDRDCLERRFRTKLISMAMSGYDRVIIEPSGVFDMDLFFDALREEPLENWYEIGNVFTIVNANLREETDPDSEFFLASQAADAGCVILSRTQLSDPEHIAATKEHIRRACETIHCRKLPTCFMEKNWDELTDEDFGRLVKAGYYINSYEKTIAGSELEYSTVAYIDLDISLTQLKNCARQLLDNPEDYGQVLRVKGFARDEGISYQLNATPYELMTDPTGVCQGVVIVIGRNLIEAKVRELLEGYRRK